MQTKTMSTSSPKVRQIVTVGMLSAIIVVLGVTGLGFIPIPPVKATIMHLPVIIGAIIEGPVVGAAIGLFFGLFSMFQAITNPTPTSFLFLNPIIAVLPRVLIGITTYYTYKAVPGKIKSIKYGVAAAVGTLTNTILVLGLIYLIYLERFAKALNINIAQARATIIGIGMTNGLPEVLVSIAIVVPVVMAVDKIRK
ncbi:ECF transporter S component [Caloramator sp. ALD01]|uniref:ECF transporter S component n=1 Tax=Caloramator sp. ALD01 TaxID=1031288 RepID=UPI000405E61A|nr:ECF transporter S component [Caloramator sp. ALD01]